MSHSFGTQMAKSKVICHKQPASRPHVINDDWYVGFNEAPNDSGLISGIPATHFKLARTDELHRAPYKRQFHLPEEMPVLR